MVARRTFIQSLFSAPLIGKKPMQPPVPVLSVVTYPPGATKTQQRIVIDGVRGAIFEYANGGPAGALVSSWASKAGTDPFGNTYPQGFSGGAGSSFSGTDFVINSSGIFVYSGTPALGNLLVSIAPLAGTDAFGNAYPQGINVNAGVIKGVQIISAGNAPEFLVYSGAPAANNLILSVSSAATTDSFGNHVLQGFAYYTTTTAYQITNGGFQYYSGTMSGGWGTVNSFIEVVANVLRLENPNLTRFTINGTEIADFSAAGQYITPGVTFQTQVATPSPSPAGNPIVFANTSGQIIVNDAADGTTYNTQTRTTRLTTASGAISSATPASVGLSQAVSARSYWVRARLYITTTSTPQFGFDLVTPAPGTDTGQIGGSIYRAATFTGSVAGAPNANNGIAIALAAGVSYMIDLDGIVTITAAGTLNLNVYNVTGGTGSYTVNAFSGIHVSPL